MNEKKILTTAFLKKINDDFSLKIDVSKSTLQSLENKSNLLIIQTISKKFLKYMVYPIQNDTVIKITIYGINFSSENTLKIFEILKNFNIIHTSGVSLKKDEIIQEIYLNPKEIDQSILEKEIKEIEGIYKLLIEKINY